MNAIGLITGVLSFLVAAYSALKFSAPFSWTFAGLFGIFACIAFSLKRPKTQTIVQLKGLSWTREDFCRGWLITGDTGSGKTRSGITQLLYQVFQNEPNWGGLCIDDKGMYWETLREMAAHFNRQNDLILLQIKPENASADWTPPNTYNLICNRTIPYSTYAKFVVDTATSLGQSGDKAFFKSQAQTHIGLALEALSETEMDITLENAFSLLLEDDSLDEIAQLLTDQFPSDRTALLVDHFENRYKKQPPEQLGGVKETIANYLQPFLTPEISRVFCANQNTFQFQEVDQGKIICVAMPQKYQMERRYINTFLKMLFYTHILRRFDKTKAERNQDNLLILWADEAQRFVTASEDGMSDYNCIDVMREAKATVVAAAQSSTSFIPPLGHEKAKVLTLNLRNRMIFKAADEQGAVESADFLGQKTVRKRSWGFSGGMMTRTYFEQEEHKIKPHQLRGLPKHTCVLVHCEKGFKRVVLAPIEPDGKVSPWFRKKWL